MFAVLLSTRFSFRAIDDGDRNKWEKKKKQKKTQNHNKMEEYKLFDVNEMVIALVGVNESRANFPCRK